MHRTHPTRPAPRFALTAALFAATIAPAPAQGWNVELVGQIGGRCTALHVDGNYLYVGQGVNLAVFDIFDPSSPIRITTVPMREGGAFTPTVYDIFTSGGLAYVVVGSNEIHIIDVTDPARPVFRGRGFASTLGGYELHIDGSMAYKAAGYSGLEIFDVSDPSSPSLVGSFAPPKAYFVDVFVTDRFAYAANVGEGDDLLLIDVSDPSSPTLRGSYEDSIGAKDVYVRDRQVYVGTVKGLLILDASDPLTIKRVGFCALPSPVYELTVSGDLVYAANKESGLMVVNVTNSSAPRVVGSYDTPGLAYDLYVDGDLAYVADLEGFHVIGVSDPASPTALYSYVAPVDATAVCADTAIVYIGSRNGLAFARPRGRVYGVDVTDPTRPITLGYCLTKGAVVDMALSSDTVYVADLDYGVTIFDFSDPSSPSLKALYRNWINTYCLSVWENLAVVGWGCARPPNSWDSAGLAVVDVHDPISPTLLSSYRRPPVYVDMEVQDGIAYACSQVQSYKLDIVDLSDPSSPVLLLSFGTGDAMSGIHVADGFAYIACLWGDGYPRGDLQILDVSDPASPQASASYDTDGSSYDVFVSNGLAYFIGDYGLKVFDVTDPSVPRLRGEFEIFIPYPDRWREFGISVVDRTAYVAASYKGLLVFQYTGPSRSSATRWSDYR